MSLACTICGKDDGGIFRCRDHYRCDDCGTREHIVFRNSGVTCDACHKIRADKQVAEFEGDTGYTQEIVCPWCGQEQSDSWEASDSEEHECDNCGNRYKHERNVQVDYSTEKIHSIPTKRKVSE